MAMVDGDASDKTKSLPLIREYSHRIASNRWRSFDTTVMREVGGCTILRPSSAAGPAAVQEEGSM